jgi:hypothetical protein
MVVEATPTAQLKTLSMLLLAPKRALRVQLDRFT